MKPIYITLKKFKGNLSAFAFPSNEDTRFYVDVDRKGKVVGIEILDYISLEIDGKKQ